MNDPTPPLLRLIEALAGELAREHLTPKPAPDKAGDVKRPNHAPLQSVDEAA